MTSQNNYDCTQAFESRFTYVDVFGKRCRKLFTSWELIAAEIEAFSAESSSIWSVHSSVFDEYGGMRAVYTNVRGRVLPEDYLEEFDAKRPLQRIAPLHSVYTVGMQIMRQDKGHTALDRNTLRFIIMTATNWSTEWTQNNVVCLPPRLSKLSI